MSLEAKIEALTEAVIAMTNVIWGVVPAPELNAAPVVAAPVAPIAAPIAVPVFAVPVFAPAAPVFAAPTAIAVPFSDGKGLLEWIMGVYQGLGPVQGAEIQNVLVSLGYQNINDVRAESYPALFTAVEALK